MNTMCVEPETRFVVHGVFNGFKLKTKFKM